MGKPAIKIYTASSVGIDYFFFLGKAIKNAGYEVEPLYIISEVKYRELAKSGGIKKVWLRLQMYLFYPLYLICKGLASERNSIFVVSSNTFFAPFLMKLVVGFKNGKVIHMLYDLFPDAIEIAGSIKVNSFKSKLIGTIASQNQKSCNATVYLGDFLKIHAEDRWGKAAKSKKIDISTDLSLYNEKLVIHYGGQLGHLHDAISIIESVKFIYQSDISSLVEFNFYVSGAQAQLLETSLKDYPVKIISAIPSSQWREDIQNFNIGLVSLSPGGASVCLPSKTYAMMAGGMAILGICPKWSDLATLINDLNAGWIINNSPFEYKEELYNGNYLNNIREKKQIDEIAIAFYEQIKFILNNKHVLSEKRKNAFLGVREFYNIDSLSNKWHDMIEDVG
jgi:Rps23 Pro-64 3,4-dihydroxylase Tpa1-like proline 4-hydroxylase